MLVFFGLVAVTGSHWLQRGSGSSNALLAGLVVGLPAAAVLLVNNYRDLEDDLRSGRRTLAAVVGRANSRLLYAVMMLLPFALLPLLAMRGMKGALLGLLAIPFCVHLIRRLYRTGSGPQLNLLLAGTAQAGFALGLLLSIGVLL